MKSTQNASRRSITLVTAAGMMSPTISRNSSGVVTTSLKRPDCSIVHDPRAAAAPFDSRRGSVSRQSRRRRPPIAGTAGGRFDPGQPAERLRLSRHDRSSPHGVQPGPRKGPVLRNSGRVVASLPGRTRNRCLHDLFDAMPQEPAVQAAVDALALPDVLQPNRRLKLDGRKFLALLPTASIPVAFLDPQYRGVLDKLAYGNEGQRRGMRRSALEQMDAQTIGDFIGGIDRALVPSGHLFLWVDKFHLCEGVRPWLDGTELETVDLVTWDKATFGMGYRTRRRAEYCVVLQKHPRKAKGVWRVRNIPDVVQEKASQREHPHAKPVDLQGRLMAAVSDVGDLVIDPAAGSFSVLEAARIQQRTFLGCDLNG